MLASKKIVKDMPYIDHPKKACESSSARIMKIVLPKRSIEK
jgi:hypothetical protein